MSQRMRRMLRLSAAAAVIAFVPRGVVAQTAAAAATCPLAGDSARADSAAADVVIIASATVQELRFDRQPRGRVRVLGCDTGGLRVLERRNLPERVEPGVTYRDVYVSVRILGTLNAACIAALASDATTGGADPASCVRLRGGTASPPPAPPPPRPPE